MAKTMSPDARRRISLAQKRRWAKRKRGGGSDDASRMSIQELVALRRRIDTVLVERVVRGEA